MVVYVIVINHYYIFFFLRDLYLKTLYFPVSNPTPFISVYLILSQHCPITFITTLSYIVLSQDVYSHMRCRSTTCFLFYF